MADGKFIVYFSFKNPLKKCGNCGNLYKTFVYGSASRFFYHKQLKYYCGKVW